MSFAWVPFYREVVQTVLTFEERQDETLSLLQEMKAAGLLALPVVGPPTSTRKAQLKNLDPFTFLAAFSHMNNGHLGPVCTWLRDKWNLQTAIPTNFEGLARLESTGHGLWFFGAEEQNRINDVPMLWELARQAFDSEISDIAPALFAHCLKIKNASMLKLTTGLSWFSPHGFLPLAGPMLPYLESRGVRFDSKALVRGAMKEYRSLMQGAQKVNSDNVALSNEAWLWRKNQPNNTMQSLKTLPQFPLNQILYGPPGTGKTFNSISRSVEIIDGFAPRNRVECRKRFEELRQLGQIEFVTFHQSFSYEEFIEGLSPVLDAEGDGQVRYEVRTGVLKALAQRAIEKAHETPTRDGFTAAWQELKRQVESGELTHIAGRTIASRHQLIFEGEKLTGENILSDKPNNFFYTTKTTQEMAWERLPAGIEINGARFTELGLDSRGQSAFNAVIHNHLLRLATDKEPDFTQAPRFVLIVDEINRGNISKILGELITLLEEDKRIGNSNQLSVKLPVSQDNFTLPPNLYILGTMNTADKSLALLDIALRRRFSFVEMPPCADLFPEFARDVLRTLNLRLEAVLDREHRLGHAYFIGCQNEEAFEQVFRDKIIPLLQEFFYNDWEGLRSVLGESGSGSGRFIQALNAPEGIRARTKWRWWFDTDDVSHSNNTSYCLTALTANYARRSGAVTESE